MTLHVPALPVEVEPDVADTVAQAHAARRRKRIETAVTVLATVAAVMVISALDVAIEFLL